MTSTSIIVVLIIGPDFITMENLLFSSLAVAMTITSTHCVNLWRDSHTDWVYQDSIPCMVTHVSPTQLDVE